MDDTKNRQPLRYSEMNFGSFSNEGGTRAHGRFLGRGPWLVDACSRGWEGAGYELDGNQEQLEGGVGTPRGARRRIAGIGYVLRVVPLGDTLFPWKVPPPVIAESNNTPLPVFPPPDDAVAPAARGFALPPRPTPGLRIDAACSLALHAVVAAGLVWMLSGMVATPLKPIALAPAEEPAATLPDPEDFAKELAPETAPVPQTAGAMATALVSAETRSSIATAIPQDAPEAIKTALGAAVERAVTHAVEMNGEAPRDAAARQALEVAAVKEIVAQLRAEVQGDFVAAASVLPGRVLDATVRSLEGKSAETLGANLRDGILAAGRELQPENPEAAEAVAGMLAGWNPTKEHFEKNAPAATAKVLDAKLPGFVAEKSAELAKAKAIEVGLAPEMADAIGKATGERATTAFPALRAKRGFDAARSFRAANELAKNKAKHTTDAAAVAAKAAALRERNLAAIGEILPGLADAAMADAKPDSGLDIKGDLKAKMKALRMIETHLETLASGRGQAGKGSIGSSLAALLAGAGGGAGAASDDALNFKVVAAENKGQRDSGLFNEKAYAQLLARLGGREPGAGSTPDLQRVAGDGAHSAAPVAASVAPASLIVAPRETAEVAPLAETTPAKLAAPPFPSVAFTAAPYAATAPVVDGDLADWPLTGPRDEARTLADNTRLASGPDVFFQWRAEGLYFAYRLADAGGIQQSSGKPYHGDCFELFIDTLNSRAKHSRDSNCAHQYYFMPFGFAGDATRTFERAGGKAAMPAGQTLAALNVSRAVSFSAARKEDGGYTVEGFLSIEAMRQRLAPGTYLGMDLSVSPDFEFPNQIQWATAKSLGNWERPASWGDLLLLGTGARLSFREINVGGAARTVGALNETLLAEVADADMNLDRTQAETVAVRFARPGESQAQVLLLTETGPDTGVFRAPVRLVGADEPARAGLLPARGGDRFEMTYIDAVNATGERNQPRATTLDVGWPVMRAAQLSAK